MVKHSPFRPSQVVVVVFLVAWPFLLGAMAYAAETPTFGAASPKVADEAAAKPAAEAVVRTAVKATTEPAVGATPSAPRKLRFQFRFQPWKDVLEWFAKQADLSLVMDAAPPGTFNYSDTHEYAPAEAIDLLNSVLLTKGYTLIRRNRMLMLINLEDGIPPNLVPTVPLNSLDGRGEFEVVRVIFDLNKLKPEEAEPELKKLLGPQGSIVSLGKSRQIAVTETAGRLRAISTTLARMEGTDGTASGGLRTFELKFARPDDVLPILHQMLDVPEGKNSSTDGSIRIAQEAGGSRLFVSGQPEKVARAADILKGLDVPAPGTEGASRVAGTPQIEVYPVPDADVQSALAVLQTLLAGQPDVRLMIDPKSNNLVALARPAQQATIRATLTQLQHEGQRVEVFRLVRLDPETVLASINKLFSAGESSKGTAPLVDADSSSRQLIIRGTEAQILQIRGMLEKMGEVLTAGGNSTRGGHVRTLSMSESSARSAMERIQEIWPSVRSNKIHIVSPPPATAEQPEGVKGPQGVSPELLKRLRELKRPGESPRKSAEPLEKPSGYNPAPSEKLKPSPTAERTTQLSHGARVIYVAEQGVAAAPAESRPAAPIVVMPGPQGLIIASDDTEALDEFERLLDMLANGGTGNRKVSVFYLKYAKAAAVTETLGQILGGTTGDSAANSGGRNTGNPMAEMLAGGPFGGFGGPFGGGGTGRRGRNNADDSSEAGAATATVSPPASRTGLATGPVKITADQRLNALLVRANRADVDTIEQLLKVLDQKESPEDISIATKPRMIGVQNTSAQEIADIVKQVYADRMVEGPATNQQRGMPFFMMGARGGNQGNRQTGTDVAKMSLGVDTRTNSLIVAAPDALFAEVRQLVGELDVAAGDQNQAVRVVTLHSTSPSAVEQALAAIAGSAVQVSRTAASTNGGLTGSPYQPYGAQQQQPNYSRRRQAGQTGQYGSPGQQPGMGSGYNSPMQQGNTGGRRGGRSGQFQRSGSPQN